MNNSRWTNVLLGLFLCTALVAGCTQKPKGDVEKKEPAATETQKEAADQQSPPAEKPAPTETAETKSKTGELTVGGYKITDNEKAVISTNLGDIELVFYPEVAPKHVENFKKLARDGFYNNTTFHRVIPNFMIQGGDPNTKEDDRSKHGMGGPGYSVNAEFNERPHKRGTLSMARSADPNSAGSQFFICVADASYLDGKYTVFGHVKQGMDVADRIVAVPRDGRDNPQQKVVMKSVTIKPL